MSSDELTPAEVKAIAAEIDAWHRSVPHPQEWKIEAISHLYKLPVECYLVWYDDGLRLVFARDEDGRLKPAWTLTYHAPDYDRKKKTHAPTSTQ